MKGKKSVRDDVPPQNLIVKMVYLYKESLDRYGQRWLIFTNFNLLVRHALFPWVSLEIGKMVISRYDHGQQRKVSGDV